MKYFIDTEFLEGTQDKRIFGIKYGETPPTIDLISIGIVAEDGREYYAISKDFNMEEAWNRFDLKLHSGDRRNQGDGTYKEYWIRENVLKPIWIDFFLWYESEFTMLKGKAYDDFKLQLESGEHDKLFTFKSFKALVNRYGKTNKQIAEDLKQIVSVTNEKHTGTYPNTQAENVQFYGYFADYDWVAFCWLFGKMIDLPKGFPMYCKDLKHMLDEKASKFEREDFFTAFDFKCEGLGALTLDEKVKHLKMHVSFPKQVNEHNAIADARWNYQLYKFLESL